MTMKIAVHHRKGSFSQHWIDYMIREGIEYKIVSCFDNDIIAQLEDCDALMWHHYHIDAKDMQFAKQLLFSLESAGKVVFPDFNTNWHFDDKLGQKYLLEAIHAPLVPSYAFYSKKEALDWTRGATFPKVFKLRGGSSSSNVRLARNERQARGLIRRAFGKGFPAFNAWGGLRDRWKKYRKGMVAFSEVLHGVARLVKRPDYARNAGRERGYVYFQDFIPDNTHDIRVTYAYNRCFASRRAVRPGDFRASGSNIADYDLSQVPEKAVKIAFEVSNRLKMQSVAFDFILDQGEPVIVEISYASGEPTFDHGYFDEDLNYYPGTFEPFAWMVEGVREEIRRKN